MKVLVFACACAACCLLCSDDASDVVTPPAALTQDDALIGRWVRFATNYSQVYQFAYSGYVVSDTAKWCESGPPTGTFTIVVESGTWSTKDHMLSLLRDTGTVRNWVSDTSEPYSCTIYDTTWSFGSYALPPKEYCVVGQDTLGLWCSGCNPPRWQYYTRW
jgi:hypothetical protein